MDAVYRELFTRIPKPEDEHRSWMDGITRQRVRTVHAGDVLFVDSYPVYTSTMMRAAREIAAARRDKAETREAQKKVNAANARKRLAALANENFGAGDILLTLTWRKDDDGRPDTALDAKKQVDRYIRRIKRLRDKRGLAAMRYIYVVETQEGPRHGVSHHVHMLTGGDGVTELELRSIWRAMHQDARVQTDTVWDRPEGLTKWAGYVTKSDNADEKRQHIRTSKRWYASQGLKRPQQTVSDTKLSRTRAERMTRDFESDGRRIMEKLYPGYQVLDLYVRTSEWLPGAYIYATMAKAPEERDRAKRRERE